MYPQFKSFLSKSGRNELLYDSTYDLSFLLQELENVFVRDGISALGEVNFLGEQIDELLGIVYSLILNETRSD